ncbi:MAG: N(4)-(beta-N-acetylglucosaminyl)-L-asparaginase [Kouleothrix sp.]|jgi:beta-aspartyl-peptidase (threonine type)|nr:N(4)-(beta-N-acetylglucosaminyl)-L-asparaginase [Kouleothrix sp.]
MILIASANGDVGMAAAWEIVRAGGTALDAVEAGTRMVEANPDDHSVGYGGYPNLLGQVELDASIMDGATLRAGAVAALQGYRHPISVARQVLEQLPHVLLAGAGAARFAAELGLAAENLLTEPAELAWRAGLAGRLPDEFRDAQGQLIERMLARATRLATDPERVAGTVNFIAQDRHGHIASAVSTSGWAWKYPGRVGDSPIIGAGNYADDRYGAAACTGWGELAIRAATARSVVLYLKQGYTLDAACREAFRDLGALGLPPEQCIMSMVALDRSGNHCAVSSMPGRTYLYQAEGMAAPEQLPRIVVAA